ncbi:MAG: Rrf2 family transcriptional regulator [Flavobacteriales bacterium]|nr:Rrf2 family transcriptional regulator [Flavobacteriales bacterium]
MFSRACVYGIRAIVCLAACGSKEEGRLNLKEVAKRTDSPEAFTAKVLQQLTRAGLVRSVKGPHGGFEITTEEARKVRLSHVVAAIDGDAIYTGCALGLHQCDAAKPCPLHDHFLGIREDLRRMLERTSVHDLMSGLRDGDTFLKR